MIPAGIIAFFAFPIVFYGFSAALIIGFFVAAAYESLGGAAFLLLLGAVFGVIQAGSIPHSVSA